MLKRISIALAFGFLLAVAVPAEASAKALPRSVLGLSPGMSEETAHRVLRRIARAQEDEEKKEEEEGNREEIWILERNADFAKVIVGFDAKNRIRYVTALAKEDGHRTSYSAVASLKDAKVETSGVFRRYTWEAKPSKKSPGYFIIAQGRDSLYLMSLSIKRVD